MQKVLIFMLLGGLAVAGVSSQTEPVTSGTRPDFYAVNKYLVDNYPDNDNVADNVAHLRSNIDRLTGRARVAGQLVLDSYDHGDQCTNQVLASLLVLCEARSWQPGKLRVREVISVARDRPYKVCWNYIKKSYRQAEPGLREFFEKFGPYWARRYIRKPYTELSNTFVYRNLKALARDDSKLKFEYEETVGRARTTKDRAKFDMTFEEPLVRPCRRVLSDDQLLEMMPAITLAQYNLDEPNYLDQVLGYKQSLTMNEQIGAMIWTRDTCREFINMDSSARTRVFES